MGRVTVRRRVVRVDDGAIRAREEVLVAEEPLEIRVAGTPMSVTMRTPGHDIELALGFALTEGIVAAADDVATIRYCAGADGEDGNTYNVLDIALSPGVPAPDPALARSFYTTSSCGICGKASLDAVRVRARWPVADDDVAVEPETLAGMPQSLRAAQRVFSRTGGLHAAALFDAAGEVVAVREDVGRHNAVDKLVGWAAAQGRLPLRGHVLLVSGRASFELTQKALMAGIPVLAAVSAPSSLAVDLAQESGMTLVGFLRGSTCNVYAGAQRLRSLAPAYPAAP